MRARVRAALDLACFSPFPFPHSQPPSKALLLFKSPAAITAPFQAPSKRPLDKRKGDATNASFSPKQSAAEYFLKGIQITAIITPEGRIRA